ncbi:hypothetical protein KP509_17G021600, partial [Ceratopteris richardii]
MRISKSTYPYEMLLGRPWFKLAKVNQDWGLNVVVIIEGKKEVTIPMQGRHNMSIKEKPLMAQTISLAEEIEDDEEEEFLKENLIVVPLLEVYVERKTAWKSPVDESSVYSHIANVEEKRKRDESQEETEPERRVTRK